MIKKPLFCFYILPLFNPHHWCGRRDIWPLSSGCRLCLLDCWSLIIILSYCKRNGKKETPVRRSARCVSTQTPAAVISATKTATHADMWFKDCYRWTNTINIRYVLQTYHRPPLGLKLFAACIDLWGEKLVLSVDGFGFVKSVICLFLYVSTRALLNQCLPTIQIWQKEIHALVTNVMDSW